MPVLRRRNRLPLPHGLWRWAAFLLVLIGGPTGAAAQEVGWPPSELLPIRFEDSAEYDWLRKPVLERRVLDTMADPEAWTFTGTGDLTFPADTTPAGTGYLRVDMEMFHEEPAPTRNGLSSVNLRRQVPGEDWGSYNRLSVWVRAEVRGFPMLPLQFVLHNEGEEAVPDAYYREGIHYVTVKDDRWHRVVWELDPLARDRVTLLEIGYWVNKRLAEPGDSVAFEIGAIALERVEPDRKVGWEVGAGRIAYSHAGYPLAASKVAIVGEPDAAEFELVRLSDNAQPEIVLRKPVEAVTTRLGTFHRVDFSEVRRPGRYVLRAGDIATEPFRIGSDVWEESTWAALNFFAGERCGHPVPGSHGVCHTDWTATFGDQRIVMNGGWHDAGDLSQGMVNTGEATYALFALAERLRERGEEPELLAAVLDEARWGLDWVLRVRFDGGHRVGFAGNNLWTNGILGDEDDPTAEAKNNPNINYIAAAAGAIGARLLRDTDPELAARALRIAEDDWQYAIAGTPGPETWATPAYGATPLELAGIGALASMELYDATGERRYADRAVELARDIVRSQQKELVGPEFPLAGFFYAGPDREQHFHQFHRGNDQAPIVALARLVERFPDHDEWMDWYGVIALYTEYQKWAATATAPFAVLPAYVYHEDGYYPIPQQAARHQGDREGFRAQVREGLDMGDGYYLRAFPVWFARRGNFGVLLSQAKGLAAGARVRGDADALDLARRQAQWILGLNPFTQSTMYGVGYDWAQQYSVSSGDLVGALPVGMQSYGLTDLPYWPSRNTYVYKEVWTHPVSRWLWLMEDLMAAHAASPRSPIAGLTAEEDDDGTVTIRAVASGRGAHTFELRAENVAVEGASRTVTLQPDASTVVEWTGRRISGSSPWVVVVVPDGDVSRSQDLVGGRRAVR